MSLYTFYVISEGPSDSAAFALAQQNPAMLGRTSYQLLDSVLFPSDQHAVRRAEDVFGVQPQESQVSIAGADTNTVWAVRIYTTQPGTKRLLFFGLRRR